MDVGVLIILELIVWSRLCCENGLWVGEGEWGITRGYLAAHQSWRLGITPCQGSFLPVFFFSHFYTFCLKLEEGQDSQSFKWLWIKISGVEMESWYEPHFPAFPRSWEHICSHWSKVIWIPEPFSSLASHWLSEVHSHFQLKINQFDRIIINFHVFYHPANFSNQNVGVNPDSFPLSTSS